MPIFRGKLEICLTSGPEANWKFALHPGQRQIGNLPYIRPEANWKFALHPARGKLGICLTSGQRQIGNLPSMVNFSLLPGFFDIFDGWHHLLA
ncbi:MAG: hypothetical protein DRI57_20305, partial [Deltaproteobacteria bacterium]